MSQLEASQTQPAQQQPTQQQNLVPRKTIGDFMYNLTDKIGEGFSSNVYLGQGVKTKEVVAIKVVDLKKITNEVQKYLLQTELRILQKLKHPNILNMRQMYQTQNNTYIITEFCNQGDLSTLLDKQNLLQENMAIAFLKDIVYGLKECESKHVIHRDLKPANIFLKDGRAKIADFGFSQDLDIPPFSQYYNVGSPNYMCPQSLIRNQYSYKSDIWSLGVLFFELLFGRVPWQAPSEKDLGIIIQKQPVAFPQQPQISDECKDFIRMCLRVEETKRSDINQLVAHPLMKVQLLKQPLIIPQNIIQELQNNNSLIQMKKEQQVQQEVAKQDSDLNSKNGLKEQVPTQNNKQASPQLSQQQQQQQQMPQQIQQFSQQQSPLQINQQNVNVNSNNNTNLQQQPLNTQTDEQIQKLQYYASHAKSLTQPDSYVQEFLDSQNGNGAQKNMGLHQGDFEFRANRAVTKDGNLVADGQGQENQLKTTPSKVQIGSDVTKSNKKNIQLENEEDNIKEQPQKITTTTISPRPHTISFTSQALESLNHLNNNDKIILSQINFCRFLHRTFQLFEEHSISQTPNLNDRIKFLFLKNLMIKISSLKQFVDSPMVENNLHFTDFNNYINSVSFKNFKQVVYEYYQKYNQQFIFYWESTYSIQSIKLDLQSDQKFEAIFDNNFSEFSSFYIILQSYLKQVIRDINHLIRIKTRLIKNDESLPSELQVTILLLDFLVILYQLVQILLNNFQDYQAFSNQSNINKLVENQQSQNIRISKEQYQKIRQTIYSLDI